MRLCWRDTRSMKRLSDIAPNTAAIQLCLNRLAQSIFVSRARLNQRASETVARDSLSGIARFPTRFGRNTISSTSGR